MLRAEPERSQERRYQVVANDEEQYSVWPTDRDLPAGWHRAGPSGTREECLAHIDEVWTDLRPLSVRRRMAGGTGDSPER
ncbi:antibiotic synthesis protein MbtH [Streptomyces sp. CB03234]|uniref:MbtH family protein n=1 Tax=Streptomyces sp. (strain CB03234) TaxID=1703937 RepID=UPI00093CC24C|nr:MbtH family protein [Streptomyces sp. CB03234]OKK03869.1 antibiotic synthesis protein MbtH [Streptomyces sp. CB03234]